MDKAENLKSESYSSHHLIRTKNPCSKLEPQIGLFTKNLYSQIPTGLVIDLPGIIGACERALAGCELHPARSSQSDLGGPHIFVVLLQSLTKSFKFLF